MDRTGVSEPGRRADRTRRPPGVAVERRGRVLYLVGTVRAAGGSVRVRESTGLAADTPGARDQAEAIRARRVGEILDQLIHGAPPAVSFAQVALSYFQSRQPGPAQVRIVQTAVVAMGALPVVRIDAGQAASWIAAAAAPDAGPSTVARYLGALRAVLRFAVRQGWLEREPHLELPRLRRPERPWLRPEEIRTLVDHASADLAPVLVMLACTGRRVAEILALDIEDVDLTPGRERVVFPYTKGDRADSAPLHPWAAATLRERLAAEAAADTRPRGETALFLSRLGRPWAPRDGKGGGQIKKGFAGARERAAAALEAADQKERAAVMRRATPHTLRHSFASALLAAGRSTREVMDLGGWKSARLLLENYTHVGGDQTRSALAALPFDASRPNKPQDKAKSRNKSSS